VVEIGSRVQSLEINDKVWALLPLYSENGFLSEFVVCDEKFVGLMPFNLSFEGAATLPYAFVTFIDCMEGRFDVKNKR
jgi:NADPH:quinone reductase-like Zn-dependent oxidoreductase